MEDKGLLSKQGDLKGGSVCTKRRLAIVVIVLAVLAAIALAVGLAFSDDLSSTTATGEPMIVQTDGGQVKGYKQDGAFVFKGIPYAKPPTGELRWQPPQACKEGECWSGLLDAKEFGSVCVQRVSGGSSIQGNENCLFLDIWTPELKPKKLRPVLFSIHGGYLTQGSGHVHGLYPTPELVKEMDIVGIRFNYRLNAFGFLALDALAFNSFTNTSGNYGFMDQIMALTWVKNNIQNFGGDPERVTLVGQSSGGTSELALLTSPLATGLFHGAIVMSAAPVFNKSSVAAAKDNEVFLTKTNCTSGTLADTRACLYGLTGEEIIHGFSYLWNLIEDTGLPTPGVFGRPLATVDGYVVPVPPLQAMATGIGINDVPVIIGNTAQEIDFDPVKDFSNSSVEEFENYTRTKLLAFNMSSAEVDEAIAMYVSQNNLSVNSPRLYYANMVSDIRVICAGDILAMNTSISFKSSVYRYIVTDWPSSTVHHSGIKPSQYAFHMWDLLAFFGFPRESASEYIPSKRDTRFMKDLRREFGSFIHTGQVKSVRWKNYPEKTGLFTDNGLKVTSAYHKKECRFWIDRGFFSYAWAD